MRTIMARQKTTTKPRPAKFKALKTTQEVAGYQFKITLPDTKPLIWRRFQVPECSLGTLHHAIQMVMGWEDAHLHQFKINKQTYTTAMVDDGGWMEDCGFVDEEAYLLRDVMPARDSAFRFHYEYDFGDSWLHELVLEKRLTKEETPAKPVCLDGKNACPPEDVGGVWGYADMKVALQDKRHPRHQDFLEWGMEDFDPAAFSVEEVNRDLKKYWR
jgi:hypothetical protein